MTDDIFTTDRPFTDHDSNQQGGAIGAAVYAVAADAQAVLAYHDRTRHLSAAIPGPDDSPVRIALIGPYSAGKTLLIGALLELGEEELEDLVDSAPKTTMVTQYDWHGVCLLDLPGTMSGGGDHEAEAEAGMRRADALLIVTTVELAGERETVHIRRLLGEEGFADRCVVVVNKINAENSDPKIIRTEVDRRLGAFAGRVPVVLTDVRDYVDANTFPDLTEDTRDVLRGGSGVPGLIAAIDNLVSAGAAALRSRAHSYELVRVLDDARTAWDPSDQEAEQTAEGERLAQAIERARESALGSVKREAQTLEATIRAVGDKVAGAASELDGSVAVPVLDEANRVQQDALTRFDRAVNEAVADARARLASDIGELVEAAARYESSRDLDDTDPGHIGGDSLFERLIVQVGEVLSSEVGRQFDTLATSGTRAGSAAHKIAKIINDTLGKEAKPYAHVHRAEQITGIAKGGQWVASIVGPVIDLTGVAKDQVRRVRIDNHRKRIRQEFAELGIDVASELRDTAAEWVGEWVRAVRRVFKDEIALGEQLAGSQTEALAAIGELRARAVLLTSQPALS